MLNLTQGAAMVLAAARSDLGAPDTHAVRFFAAGPDVAGGQARLAFAFVDGAALAHHVGDMSALRPFCGP